MKNRAFISKLDRQNVKATHKQNPLFQKDILSVDQFTKESLSYLFDLAEKMHRLVLADEPSTALSGKVLTCLFYEASTRTFSSFVAAMARLSGGVIPIQGVQYSSVVKGESLSDTVRTLERYSDVIALRHPEAGAAHIAAQYAEVPIINAGDGIGEHPTQALLDLFTILRERGTIDGLHIAMVGDLLNGRTVHSLVKLLNLFDVKISLVSPESLRLPAGLKEVVKERIVREVGKIGEVVRETDVLYVTRVQKERFTQLSEYEVVKGSYVVSPDTLRVAKRTLVLMHPLPRVGEIAEEVDRDPRAAYFRQMENGLYIRMALLAAVLGRG